MLAPILVTLVLTQAPPPPPAAESGGRQRRPVTPNELVNMLDTYAIVQAQEALQLADAAYGEFAARLKRLQQVRRKNNQARNLILQDLRRLAQDASEDEGALRGRLKALQDHESRAAEELRRAYDRLDEVLDARQQARFRLLEERLERQKLDLLLRIRGRGAAATPQPRR